MKATVIIMWNLAAVAVLWAWLCLLWDNRSDAPAASIGFAASLAVVGCFLNWYFGLGLS